MKILDTNIFLRALTAAVTPQDARMQGASEHLFNRLIDGHEEVTTVDAVIHELFYILCANNHYGLPHDDAARRVLTIVGEPGFRMPRKAAVLAAIQIFGRNEKLDFTDCLLAVYANEDGHDLTTFDRELANEAGVPVFT